MLVKERKNRKFRKKILVLFLVLILGLIIPLIFKTFFLKKPLFISPISDSNANESLVLKKLLGENKIPFESIAIASDSSYLVDLPNEVKVNISSKKEIAPQVSSLQRILRELTIKGKGIKSIDFRYDKPVITYGNE